MRTLQLIESGLKFGLDLHQMIHLVGSNLQVLRRLGCILHDMFLLFVQLVDDLILISNLIIERLDSVIPIGLFLLKLLDHHLNISNIFLDGHCLSLQSFLVIGGIHSCLLCFDQFVLGCCKFYLNSSPLFRDLSLLFMVLGHITLLFLNLSNKCLLLSFNSLILLKKLSFEIQLLFVHTIGGIGFLLKNSKLFLRVGHANKRPGLLDDDKPSPVPESHVLPEVSLANNNQLPLVPLLHPSCVLHALEDFSLDLSEPLEDKFISLLLQLG